MMENWRIYTIRAEGRTEFYVSLRADKNISFDEQLDGLLEKYESLLDGMEITDDNLICSKVFLSDYLNQKEILGKHTFFRRRLSAGAVSVIEQPPLDGSKVNLLLWFVKSPGMKKRREGDALFVEIENCLHIFQSISCKGNSFSPDIEEQTVQAFEAHASLIGKYGLRMLDNCVRTWLYVKDIDRDYQAVVRGRNRFFSENGLTVDTHFIASTGIGGGGDSPDTALCIDFYSIKGLDAGQMKYLKALDFLNPTHEYGVSFERGTSLSFNNIKHVFISGTASIDNKGRCINEGNVIEQLKRVFVNIDRLLGDAGANLDDMAQMTVYIRDIADYEAVESYLTDNYNSVPKAIVQARVCRPQWLIEVECIAVLKNIRSVNKI